MTAPVLAIIFRKNPRFILLPACVVASRGLSDVQFYIGIHIGLLALYNVLLLDKGVSVKIATVRAESQTAVLLKDLGSEWIHEFGRLTTGLNKVFAPLKIRNDS
jgi:hypothetical protein